MQRAQWQVGVKSGWSGYPGHAVSVSVVGGGADKTWVTGRDGGQYQPGSAVAEEMYVHTQCGVGYGELRPGRTRDASRRRARVGFGETTTPQPPIRGPEGVVERSREGRTEKRLAEVYASTTMDGTGVRAGIAEAADRELTSRDDGKRDVDGMWMDNNRRARGIGLHFREPNNQQQHEYPSLTTASNPGPDRRCAQDRTESRICKGRPWVVPKRAKGIPGIGVSGASVIRAIRVQRPLTAAVTWT